MYKTKQSIHKPTIHFTQIDCIIDVQVLISFLFHWNVNRDKGDAYLPGPLGGFPYIISTSQEAVIFDN